MCFCKKELTKYFNPRSRKESDKPKQPIVLPLANFNPRSRKESDPSAVHLHCNVFTFQSTLSQGERLVRLVLYLTFLKFQSTLSQGERPKAQADIDKANAISIHALARRATKAVT